MPNENTAIVDLLAGLQARPLQDDPADDVLFAGSRRPDGARRMARGTGAPPNLFEMPAPPPLPAPHLAVALPAYDRHVSTTRVPRPSKKLYLIPIGLGVSAAIVVGVFMGGSKTKPAAAAVVASAKVASGAMPAPQAAKAAAPEAQPMPAAAPTAQPIEAAAPTVPAAPTVTPIDNALPKDAVAPAEVVPASSFDAKQEATVPTVATGDNKADDAPAAAPAKKKSRKELAREKRAAKRAAKHGTAQRHVAAADNKLEKPQHADDPKLGGNGALKVASSAPREVWVDGRNSKRMTPVRVLLKPGKHKVTLFDKDHGTAKTFEVEIKPNTTTSVTK
jgi:hypothetical protein